MPGGVGMGEYWRFMGAAMLSMFLGAQSVHIFYRPLDDLDDYVKKAKEERGVDTQDAPAPVPRRSEPSVVERLLNAPGVGRKAKETVDTK